jgi:hypothetical protein
MKDTFYIPPLFLWLLHTFFLLFLCFIFVLIILFVVFVRGFKLWTKDVIMNKNTGSLLDARKGCDLEANAAKVNTC